MSWHEWAAAERPMPLFRLVRSTLSPRKRQLLACALCRLLPKNALEAWGLEALAAAEQFAEGELAAGEFRAIADKVRATSDDLEIRQAVQGDVSEATISAATAIVCVCGTSDLLRSIPALFEHTRRYYQLTTPRGKKLESYVVHYRQQCQAIREIAVPPAAGYKRLKGSAGFALPGGGEFLVPETARAIAAVIHAEQAFDRLPILADALEDDGLNDARLLDHLRHGTDHLRGCWALDVVLGRG